MSEGFQLSVYNNGAGWKSHVRIQSGKKVLERRDDGETFDHAAALATVQLLRWVEEIKGLPPSGVKFGETK